VYCLLPALAAASITQATTATNVSSASIARATALAIHGTIGTSPNKNRGFPL